MIRVGKKITKKPELVATKKESQVDYPVALLYDHSPDLKNIKPGIDSNGLVVPSFSKSLKYGLLCKVCL